MIFCDHANECPVCCPCGENCECKKGMCRPLVYAAVKDSGARQSFDTGAVRDTQEGKPRYDLIPVTALTRLATHYANGARKYGEHNWQKGIPRSRCIASLLRHVYSAITGDKSEDHWSAVVFNVFCIVHFEETNRKDMLDG